MSASSQQKSEETRLDEKSPKFDKEAVKQTPSFFPHPSSDVPKPLRVNTIKRDQKIDNKNASKDKKPEGQGLGLTFHDHPRNRSFNKAYRVDEVFDKNGTKSLLATVPRGCATAGGTSFSVDLITPRTHRYDPDYRVPSEKLIEKLLEQNYRGQAETFTLISSRSGVRSRSIGGRSTSCSPSAVAGHVSAVCETPNPQPQSSAALRRSQSLGGPSIHTGPVPRSLSAASKIVLEPYRDQPGSALRKPSNGNALPEPPATYGYRIFAVPENASLGQIKSRKRSTTAAARGLLYFTKEEREAISQLVSARTPTQDCRHVNCTDCTDIEYAYHENRAMATSLPPEERQKIINNNRSLRNIKNELESLAEHGAISDEVYDTIMRSLPSESSLNSSSRSNAAVSSVPANAFNNMRINNEPPPPAYNTPTPPSLPTRTPSQPPARAEIARAVALYRYAEPEDCTFEVGDHISVFEYMNADWWLGKNIRTGKEGVFPVNYVNVLVNSSTPNPSQGFYGNEKASGQGGYPGQQGQVPPPGPSNPYDSSVPPMAVANQPTANGPPSKGQENAKKFGKKLGNAAIFGAGATIGGNIVNSIF